MDTALALERDVITKDEAEFLVKFEQYQLENGILFYEPHVKQEDFHRSEALYRLFHGGNRSGKTFAGAAEVVWYALGTHPEKSVKAPNEGWVVSKDFNVQKEASQKLILDLLPKSAVRKISHVKSEVIDTIYLVNGSKITFKSCDSGVERFAGAAKRYIWFDEEPPKEIWNECLARIGAGQKLDIWLTMTPIFEDKSGKRIGMTWTHRELYQKKDGQRIFCVGVSIDDNPHLTSEQKEEQKRKYFGAEYDIRIKGEFKLISGNAVFDINALDRQKPEKYKRGYLTYESGSLKFKESQTGSLKIFEEANTKRQYFIGSDVGLGSGGDYSCSVVIDDRNNQVAELHGQIPPDKLAEANLLLAKYYLQPWVGVEANSFGIACLDVMKKTYAKLYYKYHVDRRNDVKTKRIGWWTDQKTKPLMIADFSKALREDAITLRSQELIDECMTYVIDEGGSANAEIGCYDDRVIAAMIAMQVRKRFLNTENNFEVIPFTPSNRVTGY